MGISISGSKYASTGGRYGKNTNQEYYISRRVLLETIPLAVSLKSVMVPSKDCVLQFGNHWLGL